MELHDWSYGHLILGEHTLSLHITHTTCLQPQHLKHFPKKPWLQLYMLYPPLHHADVRQWNLNLLDGFYNQWRQR